MRFQRGICALVLLGSGGVAVAAGCSVVTSYEGFTGTSTATCGDRVPAYPGKSAGVSADKGPLVGAAQTFRFLDEGAGLPAKLGLDLDENCATTACEPKAGNPRAIGTDNVLGAFISQLQQQKDISIQALKHGTIGLVVEVTGWNGTDSDDAVGVSVFNVAGVNGAADGGAATANDGNDVYIARDTDLLSSPVAKPLFTSSQAYVTKKRLAARFAEVRLRVIAPTAAGIVAIELSMVDAALVGTLALAKGGVEMPDAQLVGRVRDVDILRNLSQLGLCANTGQYSAIKSQICGVIDLTDSRNTDGKRRPCTSGSIAIGLAVGPAKLGTATAPAPAGPYQCASDPPDNCGGR